MMNKLDKQASLNIEGGLEMGCGSCGGGKKMDEYKADDADTDVSAAPTEPFCDKSPETYARTTRMNQSLGVGVLITMLAALSAPMFTQGDGSWKNRGLMGLGIGSMALLANYTLLGPSIIENARTKYDEVCPAYTGGGHTGEEEVDDAEVQP